MEKHGRVLDAGGVPVPGALIVISASTVPLPEIALLSDAEGQFTLRLPQGHFTFRAHGPDGAIGESVVDVPSTAREIVIVIDR